MENLTVGMNLDNYLIGASGFVKNGRAKTDPELDKRSPLAPKCGGKTYGSVLGENRCFGCDYLHNGVCLLNINDSMQGQASENTHLHRYSDLGKAILADLTVQLCRGMAWGRIPEYLRKKYAGQDLSESRKDLECWLKTPGLLSFLFLEPMFFDSCRTAKTQLQNSVFSIPYVVARTSCDACIYRKGKICSLLASEIFSKGDSVGHATVKKQIDKLRSLEKISPEVADRSRKIADTNPLEGLKFAVKSARGDEEMRNSDVLLFSEPEPLDAVEVKGILQANEMVVDVDPAKDYKTLDIEVGNLGDAVDSYLNT